MRHAGHVRGEGALQLGGDAGCQVLAEGGGRQNHRAVVAGLHPLGRNLRVPIGLVQLQPVIGGDERLVGTVRSGVAGRHADGADDQRVRLSAERVGQRSGRGDGLVGDALQRAVTLLEHCDHVGHQSTFASLRSASTRAGTASAPSPTIRPAFRSGGGTRLTTSMPPPATAASFTSSGFFLAIMMPRSAG